MEFLGKNVSEFAAAPDDEVMVEPADSELLHAFASQGDGTAFAEVVRRWGSLVYGAALRRTGDHGMAEEVAQNVLATLARRAAELATHPALAAWLQKAASYEAARALEKESNRRRLMHAYSQEVTTSRETEDATWREALPLLDAAVAALPEADRQLILLRYWQAQPFKKIAASAGSTVAACEKRVERALGRLSRTLRRRGAAVSAAALASGLAPALTKASADPAILARLTSGALTAAKSAPAVSGILTSLLLMKSKLTPAAILAALMVLCGTGGWVAGRSTSPAVRQGESSHSLTSRIAEAASGKKSAGPAAKAHPSLQALIEAAQRDLVTAVYDPRAKARAAARIAAITPEDIQAALAFADLLVAASGDSSPLTALVLQRWAEFDGRGACEVAHGRKRGHFLGLPALADPLKVWAARDPQAAFTWYREKAFEEEMGQGEKQRWKPISSLRWIMGTWALRDMNGAVQAFTSLTKKAEIDGAMIGFSEMSGTAPGRTAILDTFIAKAENPQNVWSDFHTILNRWSSHEPAELAAWLDKTKVPKSSHDSMAKPILTGWLREDAEAALDWWFKAPGGYPERAHRMESLINAWTEADVFAAAEWLAAQPLDATAARSMTTLASKVAQSDPERGFAWAMSIADEFHRKDALKQVASTWGRADKEAATAAVNAAALDETQKSEILKVIATP
jgi:RNA polymerase sigma-70 factor (ECF subfamily)